MNPDEPTETELTCLSYWFPKIRDAGLPVPKTEIVQMSLGAVKEGYGLLDGKRCGIAFGEFVDQIWHAAQQMGFPVFLRTGQGSGKHQWEKTCYLSSDRHLNRHLFNLIDWSSCADLPFNVWCVREMLPTTPLFRCTAYGGMPVVREFRFFVDGPQVLFHIPYWPEDAFEQGKPDDPAWRLSLPLLQSERHIGAARTLASAAGEAVGGKWSVDLLETQRGWFVTDMAVAERSYGWSETEC